MQQRTKVTINNDDDDDDDDDDIEEEVTDTIEKFVQTRHVQTLKYLQHVIDENRHLRLHIEHLKRRQDDPIQSPGIVDPIEPEDTPITEIPIETPQPIPDFVNLHIDAATNTDEGEDFEAKCHELNDEIINLKKQHNISREEFQRELERVDRQNVQLEKDLKSGQHQLIIIQKRDNDKQIEIQTLTASINDQKMTNEALGIRVNKLEQTNRLLTRSLTESEQSRLEVQSQLEALRKASEQTEEKLVEIQVEYKTNQKHLQTSKQEIDSLTRKLDSESDKYEEVNDENEELRENIKYLQQQIQEKVVQEEKNTHDKQLNGNFKDFIQVKRTLQACQQENELLKIELKKVQIKLYNKNE